MLREGSKAVLRVFKENSSYETTYATLEEAGSARDELDEEDGFDLIDLEQPIGSAPSLMIEQRLPQWPRYTEGLF